MAENSSNPNITLNTGDLEIGAVEIKDATGSERAVVSTANGLQVDVTRIVPGTGATALGKAEDATHSNGDTGVFALVVRKDSVANTASADGKYGALATDANGNLWAGLGTRIAGEDITNDVLKVEQRFSFANITSATTTTVKSGAGLLHSITVNTTAAGAITIYDNTAASGTKIGTLKSSIVEQTFIFNVSFTTGLTIVTAAASDITVSYR